MFNLCSIYYTYAQVLSYYYNDGIKLQSVTEVASMVSQTIMTFKQILLKEKKKKSILYGNWGFQLYNTVSKIVCLPVNPSLQVPSPFTLQKMTLSPHRKLNLPKTTANTQGRNVRGGQHRRSRSSGPCCYASCLLPNVMAPGQRHWKRITQDF